MSSVRMCDRCQVIFSENDADWSTTTGSVQRRRENGQRFNEQVTIDLCSSCTRGNTAGAIPRLPTAITAGTAAEQAGAAEREDDHLMLRVQEERITELERQLRRAKTVTGHAEQGATAATAAAYAPTADRM